MNDYALESIVRELAASDPVGAEHCVFCLGSLAHDHDPPCVWRRAREWVDANPPRVNPGWRL